MRCFGCVEARYLISFWKSSFPSNLNVGICLFSTFILVFQDIIYEKEFVPMYLRWMIVYRWLSSSVLVISRIVMQFVSIKDAFLIRPAVLCSQKVKSHLHGVVACTDLSSICVYINWKRRIPKLLAARRRKGVAVQRSTPDYF